MAQRSQMLALSHTQQCSHIETIIRHQLPRIRSETGITDTQFYEKAISRSMNQIGCGTPQSLSIWNPVATGRATADGTAMNTTADTMATDAYQPYGDAIETAIEDAATPDDAYAGIDAVVASASGLGSGDYEVVQGIASTAASSVAYWYDVQQAGSGGGGHEPPPEPMSIYTYPACRFWCEVGWSDVALGLTGAASVLEWTGGVAVAAPEALLAGFTLGAVGGSIEKAMGTPY